MVGGVTEPAADKAESADLFDIWIVEADRKRELTERIGALARNQLATRPGFVFAQIYESEGNEVLLHLRTRTAADRRAIIDSAELQHSYRELRKIATSHAGFYRLVDSVGDGAPQG
jgi:hypothetical protein